MVRVSYARAVIGVVQDVAFRLRAVDDRVVRITESVTVRVGIVGGRGRTDVCIQRIAVVSVGYAVSVDVVVADVTQSVAVQIGLVSVGHGGTVVLVVGHAIPVGIRHGGDHLDSQGVGIGSAVVIRDRQHHCVVAGGESRRSLGTASVASLPRPGVGNDGSVGVGRSRTVQFYRQRSLAGKRSTHCNRYGGLVFLHYLTSIADAVAVRIRLIRIGHGRAIIGIVQHVTFRLRTVDDRVVRVTEAVTVRVGIVGSGGRTDARIQRIAVVSVGYAVSVDVVVADVTHSVTVHIGLIGIRNGGTVVLVVGYSVTVGIGSRGNDLYGERIGIGGAILVRNRQHHGVVTTGEGGGGFGTASGTSLPRPHVADDGSVRVGRGRSVQLYGQRSVAGKRGSCGDRDGSLILLGLLTGIADTITVRIKLVRVGNSGTVVRIIKDVACRLHTVLYEVGRITESIFVEVSIVGCSALIRVGDIRTVVLCIGNSIAVGINPFCEGLNQNAVDIGSPSVIRHGKCDHIGTRREGLGDDSARGRTGSPIPTVGRDGTVLVIGRTGIQVNAQRSESAGRCGLGYRYRRYVQGRLDGNPNDVRRPRAIVVRHGQRNGVLALGGKSDLRRFPLESGGTVLPLIGSDGTIGVIRLAGAELHCQRRRAGHRRRSRYGNGSQITAFTAGRIVLA